MLQLIQETPHFLAINKPPGISFHTEETASGTKQGIVEQVRSAFNSQCLYPVHRLDRVTSGLMLFAKTPEANRLLTGLFQTREIQKTYWAISDRKPKKKQGLIRGDMTKSRGGSYKLLRTMENPASTRFQAKSIGLHEQAEEASQSYWAFELRPKTGKTHQLRVALKSLGSPILGDDRYGGTVSDRCYLHAYSLEFDVAGEHYVITADFTAHDSLGLFKRCAQVHSSC